MIKLPKFTKESLQQLDIIRYNHKVATVRRRAAIVYFKALGYPHREIQTLAKVSSTTLTITLKLYLEGGIEKITNYESKPRRLSALESYKDVILSTLKENPPHTLKEAAHEIFKITKINRSRFSVSKFLKSLGFKHLKTGSLPAKADLSAQTDFKKKN